MTERKIRTYPLRWFDSLLASAVAPFAKAESLAKYATNGYYLMGICLATVILLLWLLGLLSPRNPTPVWLLEAFRHYPEMLGLHGLPGEVPPLALLAMLYVLLALYKTPQHYVGEKFADAFFGAANACVRAGDWCVEHRWAAFLIVILLAAFITWGVFYLYETAQRGGAPVSKLHQQDIWIFFSYVTWGRQR